MSKHISAVCLILFIFLLHGCSSGGSKPEEPQVLASDDSYQTFIDIELSIVGPGVLGNDFGDGIWVSSCDAVSAEGGTVVMATNGNFTYSPPAGYSGIDSFTYTATDGKSLATGNVSVTVEAITPFGEIQKRLSSDAQTGDLFGFSVSISGDYAVVGAHQDDSGGSNTGAAYIFHRDHGGSDNWGEVVKLAASDALGGAQFGYSVAISGDLVIVGAPYESSAGRWAGAVYVFSRDQGGVGNWGEVTKVVASDAEAYDRFGFSVSVSSEYAIIGAPYESTGEHNSGAAYLFHRNQGGVNSWGELEKITGSDTQGYDTFGNSVSISSDYAIVRASWADSVDTRAGTAYVFYRNKGGADNWGEVQKLVASDAGAGDQFGFSVLISGNHAIVGAPYEDTGGNAAGAAYLFHRDQGDLDSWGEVTKFTASDAESGDQFGFSASISDGYVIIGAPFDNVGAAYFFHRHQGGENNWGEVCKVTAFDAGAYDHFGISVSISGDYAAVGAHREDTGGGNAGAVYFLKNRYSEEEPTPTISSNDDQYQTDIDTELRVAAPGVMENDSGVGIWVLSFDMASAEGGTVTMGTGGSFSYTPPAGFLGSDSFVYTITNGIEKAASVVSIEVEPKIGGTELSAVNDTYQTYLATELAVDAPGVMANDSGDGIWVSSYDTTSVEGGTIAMTVDGSFTYMPPADFFGTDSFTYVLTNGVEQALSVVSVDVDKITPFIEIQKRLASDAAVEDYYGSTVCISGDYAIVGAYKEDTGGYEAGAAYILHRNQGGANNWGEVTKLLPSDPGYMDFFGASVSISGDYAIVGAYQERSGGLYAGAAYVFYRNQGGINNWGEVAKLKASDAEANDHFGRVVSISGDHAIVGAHGEDGGGDMAGAAYIFKRDEGGVGNWGEVVKLVASDAEIDDQFGSSVSIDGNHAIVGAYLEDSRGTSAGAAYVFDRNKGGGNNWGEVTKITASDAAVHDNFARALSLGNGYAIVGAGSKDYSKGVAYLFHRDEGGSDNWGEVCKLTAPDAERGDYFGFSVAVSGDYALIGAIYENSFGNYAGAAYLFHRYAGGEDNWGEVTKLHSSDEEGGDKFGLSVSIDGDHAIIGANAEDSGGSFAGAAYLFKKECCGETEPGAGVVAVEDEYRASVNEVLFAPAPGVLVNDTGTGLWVADYDTTTINGGSVDVGPNGSFSYTPQAGFIGTDYFNYTVTDGLEQATGLVVVVVEVPSLRGGQKLIASDVQAYDSFGYSVALNSEYAIVGAFQKDTDDTYAGEASGAAYIFHRDQGGSGNWGEVAKLVPSVPERGAYAGESVALGDDFAVVGALFAGNGAQDFTGAAHLFQRDHGGADNWGEVLKLTASDAQESDFFGRSASVSGDDIIIGANCADPGGIDRAGAAYVFHRNEGGNDNWGEVAKLTASDGLALDFFGASVAISGDYAVVGSYGDDSWGSNSGAVYVFYRNQSGANNWGEVVKLTASDASAGDTFGSSVSASGDYVIVGARYGESGGASAGAAYIFHRNEGGVDSWGEVAKITASDANTGDEFGISVAINGYNAIVGAFGEGSGGSLAGAAYHFNRNQGGMNNWGEVKKLVASDAETGDKFGISVSTNGSDSIVGAQLEDTGASDAGAAYIFETD